MENRIVSVGLKIHFRFFVKVSNNHDVFLGRQSELTRYLEIPFLIIKVLSKLRIQFCVSSGDFGMLITSSEEAENVTAAAKQFFLSIYQRILPFLESIIKPPGSFSELAIQVILYFYGSFNWQKLFYSQNQHFTEERACGSLVAFWFLKLIKFKCSRSF